MKVILEIPDEEVEIINRNGFNKDGSFSFKLNEVVKQAIRNGVILPDNATNGDVIKAMFPNCKDWKAKLEDNDGEVYEVHFVQLPNSLTVNKYEESWWNAPYKGGQYLVEKNAKKRGGVRRKRGK